MTIYSEPSHALVVLDGQEIGHTPVSVPFTYYGNRQITLIKDGYKTKTINQEIAAPWYQIPGLDFFSEVLWPFRIRDHRIYSPEAGYVLEREVVYQYDDLQQRADQLRAVSQPLAVP